MRHLFAGLCLLAVACGPSPPTPSPKRLNVLVITIDTLRADRVGAYGHAAARTPALDGLARDGTRFDRAFATAPITLTSHASLMTGRYPPGHGARHNGVRVDLKTPTLADAFSRAGFATAAFVAAFPLDRRFGLIKGFQTYGDTMPRDAGGRLANDRPGRPVVDEAIRWLDAHRQDRVFVWVHLFEPHAPYGNPADPSTAQLSVARRYDADIAEADTQTARLLAAVDRTTTLIVAAADHGEAFGEHGEIAHSVFAYDTTLRVPLILAGPGVPAGRVVSDPVSLIDVAPTVTAAAGLAPFDSDGLDLLRPPSSVLPPPPSPLRPLYAESFAPLLDFGWSPLRTIRHGKWKYISAPKAELYDIENDPGETKNLIAREPTVATELARKVDAIGGDLSPGALAAGDRETRARLQALGYLSGSPSGGQARPDPKDRVAQAARLAEIASGELQGAALEGALRAAIKEDPKNPQANVRLGYVLMNSGRCPEAIARFTDAIAAKLPGAEAHLGKAGCELAAKRTDAARATLDAARQIEPDNPVVEANLGLLLSDTSRPQEAVPHLQRALTLDPDLHQARFALAIAFASTNRRGDAAREAQELLRRLPAGAPQRPEVERLLTALK